MIYTITDTFFEISQLILYSTSHAKKIGEGFGFHFIWV